jgi:quinoprotein glucose dehydrogenase
MMLRRLGCLVPVTLCVIFAGCAPPTDSQDQSAVAVTSDVGQVEWRHHGNDLASSKYSPLDQINGANFSELEVAWRWESADRRLGGAYDTGHYTATPLMVGGVVYAATSHGQIAALDAANGKQLWLYDPRSWARPMYSSGPRRTRGIEYWTDGEIERIFIATLGKQLVSVDALTGKPDPAFGDNGIVDLTNDLGVDDRVMERISHSAPPIVVRDTVIVGSKIDDFASKYDNPPGHVRAYDARTGKLKWRFHTIPQEGEPFTETWAEYSWKKMGNTNVWTMMTADEELGYVYLPTSTPTNDYYGGERHGDNLFAESLVCVDVETGERVWHFQTVHHGIWDYDIASAPNLIDVEVDGRLIKAVAQVSKTGFTYVFDRATGEPVWPIEERPVPASLVPGEKLSPTQPFPTKPPPFDRQGVSEEDLIDFTPELKAEALEIASELRLGPIFEPIIVEGAGGKRATIAVPGAGGGASYQGASIDPDSGMLYVESHTWPTAMAVVRTEPGTSDFRYEVKYHPIRGPRGLPLVKPPYRRLTAIDLKTGEHVFQVPVGDGPIDHPAIKHLNLPPMGSRYPSGGSVVEGGILVTKTILIGFLATLDELCASSLPSRLSPSTCDRVAHGGHLRALDKNTGAVLGQIEVDRSLHSAPMTYMHEGRQYIAVAGGGGSEDAELVVFALGQDSP